MGQAWKRIRKEQSATSHKQLGQQENQHSSLVCFRLQTQLSVYQQHDQGTLDDLGRPEGHQTVGPLTRDCKGQRSPIGRPD